MSEKKHKKNKHAAYICILAACEKVDVVPVLSERENENKQSLYYVDLRKL